MKTDKVTYLIVADSVDSARWLAIEHCQGDILSGPICLGLAAPTCKKGIIREYLNREKKMEVFQEPLYMFKVSLCVSENEFDIYCGSGVRVFFVIAKNEKHVMRLLKQHNAFKDFKVVWDDRESHKIKVVSMGLVEDTHARVCM